MARVYVCFSGVSHVCVYTMLDSTTDCRLVQYETLRTYVKYIYVYVCRHYAARPDGSAAKVTLRTVRQHSTVDERYVHQLYESCATIIYTAI